MTEVPAARLAAVTPLFREVTDLKRVRVAHAEGSVADRSFARAWAAVLGGADEGAVADAECAAALAGARLAGIDADVLAATGVADPAAVLRRAIDEVAGPLHPATVARVRVAPPVAVEPVAPPPFVDALRRQPRAGATAPGRPRLVVEPPEDHAEHCWAVAVLGALLADDLGADPGAVFLLGLAHHLHNAALPDAGFAGETLLGAELDPLVERLTERELATLPDPLAGRVRDLLALRADADTPVGRAFHAADVLDRVLQVHHHARAAAFTPAQALDDLDLVHAGPVTGYHDAVLAAAGLAVAGS
ncbi:HD domain-containing protein [Pseudonocardia oceani]|uniref:HD domain-containing protein n=1 Tax=Pseudonocardia oceani TaxID=2792013 RepID=UPI001CF704A3|nr:HD domain-containing protein [Pseudonocardia oceani]